MGTTKLTPGTFAAFMERELPRVLGVIDDETWPLQYCFDTCNLLRDPVRREFSGAFDEKHGPFNAYRLHPRARWTECEGHVWFRQRGTGIILDPTLGQFDGGCAYRLVPPGDPLYERYNPA